MVRPAALPGRPGGRGRVRPAGNLPREDEEGAAHRQPRVLPHLGHPRAHARAAGRAGPYGRHRGGLQERNHRRGPQGRPGLAVLRGVRLLQGLQSDQTSPYA